MKYLELEEKGIDYWLIPPDTIILLNKISRLDNIYRKDNIKILSDDGVDWKGIVEEVTFNSIRIKRKEDEREN